MVSEALPEAKRLTLLERLAREEQLGPEVSVDKLLLSEPILARHLAEATGEAEAKKQMLQRLLGGRVGTAAMDVLDTAVSVRWSRTSDFVDAIEHVARLSLLAAVTAVMTSRRVEVRTWSRAFMEVVRSARRSSMMAMPHPRPSGTTRAAPFLRPRIGTVRRRARVRA